MNLKNLIRSDYSEYVRLSKYPGELKDSLKTSDRVPVFVDNLVEEFKKMELAGIIYNRNTIKDVTYNMTEIFLKACMANVEKMYASDMEKERQKAADEAAKKFDKDGNADFTEELGIKITDG